MFGKIPKARSCRQQKIIQLRKLNEQIVSFEGLPWLNCYFTQEIKTSNSVFQHCPAQACLA